MVDVVNAVGGSYLNREVDLDALYEDLCIYSCKFNPDVPSRMYLQLTNDSPTISLFRTGKYSIAGAGSVSELIKENKNFKELLTDLGITEYGDEISFDVRYLVGIGDLEHRLDLSHVFKILEPNAEYEPEQFPALYYSPDESITYIIFSTGKVSINGPKTKKELEGRFDQIKQILD